MRRFLVKTIFISLPILLLGVLMEVLLRNTPNDYLLKKHYLDKNASQIETLILGSSHAFYGFNPDYFSSNTFNASHISQSLDYDFKILKKYEAEFKNLKTIILPVSYFTLFGNLETGPEPWRVKNYVLYYNMHTAKSIVDYSEVLSNRVDLNLKRLFSFYVMGKSPISCSTLGWGTNYLSKDARDLNVTGKEAAKRHSVKDINSTSNREMVEHNTDVLNDIIKWCNERNVQVLLLMTPAFDTYRNELNPQQLNLTMEVVKSMDLTYDNCIYLNLIGDNRFQANDFFDADHLSEIGSKKLSVIVNEEVNKWM